MPTNIKLLVSDVITGPSSSSISRMFSFIVFFKKMHICTNHQDLLILLYLIMFTKFTRLFST